LRGPTLCLITGLLECNMRVTSLVLVVAGTTIKTGNPNFYKLGVRSALKANAYRSLTIGCIQYI
jgi:hypothetical protein